MIPSMDQLSEVACQLPATGISSNRVLDEIFRDLKKITPRNLNRFKTTVLQKAKKDLLSEILGMLRAHPSAQEAKDPLVMGLKEIPHKSGSPRIQIT